MPKNLAEVALLLSSARACWDSTRVYHGGGDVDHGCEALIGFVGAHRDAFELFELAEEVFDQMAPFVYLLVDGARLCAAGMLGDNDFGAARVEIFDDGVAVEGLVSNKRVERDAVNERRKAPCIVLPIVMPIRTETGA